jgi:hypothetical protein
MPRLPPATDPPPPWNVLVAVVRKQLKLDVSFYTLMRVLSVTVIQKASIASVFSKQPTVSNVSLSITNKIYLIDRTVVAMHGGLWGSFSYLFDLLTYLLDLISNKAYERGRYHDSH